MGKFFDFMAVASGCDWYVVECHHLERNLNGGQFRIEGDVIDHTRAAGLSPSNLGQALLAAIDNVSSTCAIS